MAFKLFEKGKKGKAKSKGLPPKPDPMAKQTALGSAPQGSAALKGLKNAGMC